MPSAKHAYLIIAHSNLYVLERLLQMLDDERNDLFLHIDKKATGFSPEKLQSLVKKSRLYLVRPLSVYWGHASQVDCEMRLLEACVRAGDYAYVHLLSGVDLPIQTQDTVHAFFAAHPDTQFLQVGYGEAHRYRLEKYHLFVKHLRHRKGWMDTVEGLKEWWENRFSVNRLKRYGDLPIVKTANWFSITGACARYVVNKKAFIRRLTRFTVCADEMFLGTVIAGSPYWEQVYNKEPSWDGHMRYIDRERNVGSSPHTFTMEDKPLLEASPMLFARKFDEKTDRAIIDWVYTTYGKDEQR